VRKRQLDLFFAELDRSLGQPAVIILTGAGAGSLMGHIRPSLDIDFEIRLKNPSKRNKLRLAKILREVSGRLGTAINFSEDIGHWSMISFLDYRRTALPYRRFGKLTVKLMAPAYWTIGKMARFYELDIQDMIKVIRKQRLKPDQLLRIWKRALAASPLSRELGQFKEHVNYFLKTYGRKLWGKSGRPPLL